MTRDPERSTESRPTDAGAKQRLDELLLARVEFAALQSDSSERLEELFDVDGRGGALLRRGRADRLALPDRFATVVRRRRPVQPED